MKADILYKYTVHERTDCKGITGSKMTCKYTKGLKPEKGEGGCFK